MVFKALIYHHKYSTQQKKKKEFLISSIEGSKSIDLKPKILMKILTASIQYREHRATIFTFNQFCINTTLSLVLNCRCARGRN